MQATEILKRYGGRPKNGGPPNVNTAVSGRAGKRVARQAMQTEARGTAGETLESLLRVTSRLTYPPLSDKWWRETPAPTSAEMRQAQLLVRYSKMDTFFADVTQETPGYSPPPPPPRPERTYHGPLTSHCGHLERPIKKPKEIEQQARELLAAHDFDTMIGRGLSGALVVPWLARALGKHWAIVRKDGDGSHSMQSVEGTIGRRWIFVDDFICSGTTRRETMRKVREHCDRYRHLSEYTGTYSYVHTDNGGYFTAGTE